MKDALRAIVGELPGIRWLRERRYERSVQTTSNWRFWGEFSGYDDALAAAPKNPVLSVGYDTPGMPQRGGEIYEQMHLYDYPALVGLLRFAGAIDGGDSSGDGSSSSNCTVIDLGGHLGAKYRVFRRFWTPSPGFRWIVCETPVTVEAAASLPSSEVPPGLTFTTDRRVMNEAQVLHASGVLAYLEVDLWQILDALAAPPPHLVLNKVPLTRGSGFWTLQNASGLAAVPYHVFNRERFVGELADRGYRVVDEWSVAERKVEIPFREGIGTDAGTGMCLTREPAAAPSR